MNEIYNIYCDESCHLENDRQKVMVLGGIWCSLRNTKAFSQEIRSIKQRYGFNPKFEIKFTKVSEAKIEFYLDLLDCFFRNELHFRALVIPDKSKLDHLRFGQTHDDWYYKMYFDMLKTIFNPEDKYRIYIDIKDTKSARKVAKLHQVLCNNMYDFNCNIIERVQTILSHESEILQLADLLIGTIGYANKGLTTNPGKLLMVERLKALSGYSLVKTTLYKENKVNILKWQPTEDFYDG